MTAPAAAPPAWHYFPVLFLVPASADMDTESGPFRLRVRRWGTSTFDLATLATRHRLHLPYQLMDVMLGRCNLEVGVLARTVAEALALMHSLRLGLYVEGVSPFLAPYCCTHSVNDYSGINSRDSTMLRDKLSEGLRDGLTSDAGTVEAWPHELSMQCAIFETALALTADHFAAAASHAGTWAALDSSSALLPSGTR